MKLDIINILNADATQIKKIFEDLDKNGILDKYLPELTALKGVDNTKESYHKDNFLHTIQVVENTYFATKNPWIRLVALLHDIGKAKTKKWINGTGWSFHNHEIESAKMLHGIFKRLKIPNEHYDYVHKLVINHGHPKALTIEVTDSALRRFGKDLGEDLEDLILFCKCDLTSKKLDKKERQLKAYDKVYKDTLKVREKDKLAEWRCPIDGNFIMEYFNVKGEMIGFIKKLIIDAIKTGAIGDNYDEAFEFMKNLNYEKVIILLQKHKEEVYDRR